MADFESWRPACPFGLRARKRGFGLQGGPLDVFSSLEALRRPILKMTIPNDPGGSIESAKIHKKSKMPFLVILYFGECGVESWK